MQQLLGDWVSHSQTQSAVFPQEMCSPRSEERYQAHQWTWPLGPCPLLPPRRRETYYFDSLSEENNAAMCFL